jgi:hypothetical protein
VEKCFIGGPEALTVCYGPQIGLYTPPGQADRASGNEPGGRISCRYPPRVSSVGLPGLEPGTSSLSETKACVVDVRCCSVNPAKWQFFNLQLSRAFAAVHGRCRQTVVNCRTRCRHGEISCRRVLVRYSTHTATSRRVPVKHLGAKCPVVSRWCQKAPSQDQAFLTFSRFAGFFGARSTGLQSATF